MTEAAADPFRLVGSVVDGKYRIDDILGEGGHGIVYAGTHVLLGAPIAIKVLKPFHTAADVKKSHDLFLREARILFALTHPSIVRLYDVGELETPIGKTPYVVLEKLDGHTLGAEIGTRIEEKRAFSVDEIRRMQVDSDGRGVLVRQADGGFAGTWGLDPSDSKGGKWLLKRIDKK